MWIRRALAMSAAAITLITIAADAAVADGPDAPFYGDLNGDGRTDRATLFPVELPECGVRVEFGRPAGGYSAPTSYIYRITNPEVYYCPDLGVIIDLAGDGTAELVVSWYWGGPSDADLLVLRHYRPVAEFRHDFAQPNYIGREDFDGDGRQDIYVWADVGGIANYLNTADGRLVPGPIRFGFCSYPPWEFEFADFHGNGGRGLLIAWRPDCDTDSGVAVVGYDGARVNLERDPDGEVVWTATALDADGDGDADVRTEHPTTREVTHHISLGDGNFGESPRAVFDRPTVNPTRPTRIRVLDNDLATRQATVTITSQPKYGTVRVNPDRTITYTPQRPHDGGDRFTYRLGQDGKQNTTAVSMRFTG